MPLEGRQECVVRGAPEVPAVFFAAAAVRPVRADLREVPDLWVGEATWGDISALGRYRRESSTSHGRKRIMSASQTLTQSEVVDIMRSKRFVMLTTVTTEGKLVSHPMSPQEVTDEADVWFFVGLDGDQADALRAAPEVNLAFAEAGSWLSVSGSVEFVDDPVKVDQLWDGALEAYFDGVQDPKLGLIRVLGHSAQFWGIPGGKPAMLAQIAKAKISGARPSGETRTTDL